MFFGNIEKYIGIASCFDDWMGSLIRLGWFQYMTHLSAAKVTRFVMVNQILSLAATCIRSPAWILPCHLTLMPNCMTRNQTTIQFHRQIVRERNSAFDSEPVIDVESPFLLCGGGDFEIVPCMNQWYWTSRGILGHPTNQGKFPDPEPTTTPVD